MPDRRLPEVVRRVLHGMRRAEPAASETKVVLGDYYSALASSGIYSGYRTRPWPVERAVADAYERIVYVYKAVEAISGNASRLPFQLTQGGKPVKDHPLYRVLNQQANPLETGPQFRKRLSAQVLLSKRGAFVEVTKSRAGDVVRMDLLPPGRTRPVPADKPGPAGSLIDHFEVLRADGTRAELEPEFVRWFREPHPLDPFSGTTPLEAAGMSAELDLFSRLYNVQFLRHDARPGGVLAVDGEMTEGEMDRIEGRFGAGPVEAGKLSVIAGKVSYIDLAARPRDMAYETTAATAKREILTAFGVGESVIGDASGRTWDNAEQELYNFWTVTMLPHLGMLSTGFDEDSTDDLETGFDLTGVEVLQRAESSRREEARKEFEAGLISPDEYRERAGLRPFGLPETRALYVPAGKTMVATSKKDADALAEKQQAQQPAALPPGQEPLPEEEEQAAGGKKPALPASPGKAEHDAAVAEMKAVRPPRRLVVVPQRKTAGWVESSPDEAARDRFEAALTATLTALLVRLVQRAATRVESPKLRKGTRHWAPRPGEQAETKALDAGRIVEPSRWGQEAAEAVGPVVRAHARTAAAALLDDLSPGREDTGTAEQAAEQAAGTAAETVASVLQDTAVRLVAQISAADAGGASADGIASLVREKTEEAAVFAARVASETATAATGQARDAAATLLAEQSPELGILRQWRSRRNAQTRETHHAAHGQHQPPGVPFQVGGAAVMFPGDPNAPPGERINCKCVLNYRAKASGRYVSAPRERAS